MNGSESLSQTFETLNCTTERSCEKRNGVMIQPLSPAWSRNEIEEADMNAIGLHVAEILEDLRLAQRVERELQMTGYLPLRTILVSASGRFVILQGRVPSYYLKQVAGITALGVMGVEELRNDLEIVPGEPR